MTVEVDRETCIGCNLCVGIAPEVFEMDAESIATVIAQPTVANKEAEARDAAESCPVGAISIEE